MREDLTFSVAWFEPLDDADLPSDDWTYQLHVLGSGFVHRAAGLLATVGEVDVEQIMINPDSDGFSGLLRQAPPEGAPLRVGWMDGPMIETGIVFNSPGDA